MRKNIVEKENYYSKHSYSEPNEEKFEMIFEEVTKDNKVFRISKCIAPSMEVDSISIAISFINEKDKYNYEQVYKIEYDKIIDKVNVSKLKQDKKGSSHDIVKLTDEESNNWLEKILEETYEVQEFSDKENDNKEFRNLVKEALDEIESKIKKDRKYGI